MVFHSFWLDSKSSRTTVGTFLHHFPLQVKRKVKEPETQLITILCSDSQEFCEFCAASLGVTKIVVRNYLKFILDDIDEVI